MNWKVSITGILFCLGFTFASKKQEEDSNIFSSHTSHTLPIEHAFGPDDDFTPRGNIVFKTSKVTTASFQQDVELSDAEVDKLLKVVKDDQLYFIRSPTKIGGVISGDSEDSNEVKYVSTFVRACYLYGSALSEIIKVAVDNSGNVIGLSIVSPRHDCSIAQKKTLLYPVFNSTVLVHQQVLGAVPDTQTYVKKLEHDKAEEAAGKGKDNRSFFAKYWMYIVPVFLVLVLSSQAEPPAEGE